MIAAIEYVPTHGVCCLHCLMNLHDVAMPHTNYKSRRWTELGCLNAICTKAVRMQRATCFSATVALICGQLGIKHEDAS